MRMPDGAVTLAVLALSDSFGDLWPELAGGESALRRASAVDELEGVAQASAVVVAAGGVEADALEVLPALLAAGARNLAIVGAATDHRLGVAAVSAGAADYFALPADLSLLRSWVGERLERSARRAASPPSASRYDFSELIGESEGLLSALDRAARVIPHGSSTVLITGETGTGKELLARAIHDNGPRASEPFIELNCSAVPANLLEAELFGYEKGAFTGAVAAKPGLFEAAHRGTLFLDEIGELSVELQAKLLRVLEGKSVRRVGGLRSSTLDVRILAATHRDLTRDVRDGRFRQDLFYRLSVLPLRLPPLRERGEDVLLLARHFADRFAREYDMPVPELDDEVRRAIMASDWPGNVRELRNAIERAVLLGGGRLTPDDLFMEDTTRAPAEGGGELPFPASLDRIEEAAAHAMVRRFEGNKTAAAEALGISRGRLYRLLGEAPD